MPQRIFQDDNGKPLSAIGGCYIELIASAIEQWVEDAKLEQPPELVKASAYLLNVMGVPNNPKAEKLENDALKITARRHLAETALSQRSNLIIDATARYVGHSPQWCAHNMLKTIKKQVAIREAAAARKAATTSKIFNKVGTV